MSNKQPPQASALPADFFDFNKKSKKAQDDALSKELEQFEKEMSALDAESEEQMREEFDKLQDEKNVEELDQQLAQWKKIVELEKRAELLKAKPFNESSMKKLKTNEPEIKPKQAQMVDESEIDLDNIEDFVDRMSDWRSKGI